MTRGLILRLVQAAGNSVCRHARDSARARRRRRGDPGRDDVRGSAGDRDRRQTDRLGDARSGRAPAGRAVSPGGRALVGRAAAVRLSGWFRWDTARPAGAGMTTSEEVDDPFSGPLSSASLCPARASGSSFSPACRASERRPSSLHWPTGSPSSGGRSSNGSCRSTDWAWRNRLRRGLEGAAVASGARDDRGRALDRGSPGASAEGDRRKRPCHRPAAAGEPRRRRRPGWPGCSGD